MSSSLSRESGVVSTASPGVRIRSLFSQSRYDTARIIAPFMKARALSSLLELIPSSTIVYCVTRWLPADILSGVSDLEVLDLIESRDNAHLSLVENLHAKAYLADDRCLVGSANVTLRGLGDTRVHNLEVLVETTIEDPGIASLLQDIADLAKPATRQLADQLSLTWEYESDVQRWFVEGSVWIPLSFRPEESYSLYARVYGGSLDRSQLAESERAVVLDILRVGLLPNLTEGAFSEQIRERLAQIDVAKLLLETEQDIVLSLEDTQGYFDGFTFVGVSSGDLWRSFVSWMCYFYGDLLIQHEISKLAIRRARRLA